MDQDLCISLKEYFYLCLIINYSLLKLKYSFHTCKMSKIIACSSKGNLERDTLNFKVVHFHWQTFLYFCISVFLYFCISLSLVIHLNVFMLDRKTITAAITKISLFSLFRFIHSLQGCLRYSIYIGVFV